MEDRRNGWMTEYEKDLEIRVDDLQRIIRNKNNRIQELNSELIKINNKLVDAEWKIDKELKPRIESEKRSYDNWVLSGGSDDCFRNGMNGNCGPRCSVFCERPECTDELSNEQLLEYYIENDACENIVFGRGLWFKKALIDWKSETEQIKKIRKSRIEMFLYNFNNRRTVR